MSNKFTVILDDEDADLLKSLARIFSSFQATGVEEQAPTEETPTTTRRRRAGADAGSSSTEPASDAGASDGRRRRRTSEPAEETTAVPTSAAGSSRRARVSAEAPSGPTNGGASSASSDEPVRRRRTASAVEGISDAEVAKAASQAAAKITPAVVMQILKEDYNVTTANEVPQDKRQKFLDTLKAEMAD